MKDTLKLIVWASEPTLTALRARLTADIISVTSAQELFNSTRDPKIVSVVDLFTLAELDRAVMARGADQASPRGPVIAICDEPIQTAIGWLPSHPWLSHVISGAMLQHPMIAEHLGNVITTLTQDGEPRLLRWLGPTVAGRRVLLARASARVERLERMSEFFDSKGVGSRTIQLLRDAAEELLTNAFYDAPVAAGASKRPISRTQDVALPEDSACHMVYGCRDDLAIVRVRDPFGSLTRTRLVEVLTRCARTDMQVEVDESMGGAGLGMWRIFSAASFVAVSVLENRKTEFLVGVAKRSSAGPRPFAFHLFFRNHDGAVRRWKAMADEVSVTARSVTVTKVDKD